MLKLSDILTTLFCISPVIVPGDIEQAAYELARLKKIEQKNSSEKYLENFDSTFRHFKPMLPRSIPLLARLLGIMAYLIGIGFIIAAAKKKWIFLDKSPKRKMSHLANKAEKILTPKFR